MRNLVFGAGLSAFALAAPACIKSSANIELISTSTSGVILTLFSSMASVVAPFFGLSGLSDGASSTLLRDADDTCSGGVVSAHGDATGSFASFSSERLPWLSSGPSSYRVRTVFSGGQVACSNAQLYLPPILEGIDQISAKLSGACGLDRDAGAIYCWGDDSYGQLGEATGYEPDAPRRIVNPPGVNSFKKVVKGGRHACAVAQAAGGLGERIFCWGANDRGQLGDGTFGANRSRPEPVQTIPVTPGIVVEEISAGNDHNCAWVYDGTNHSVYCWGANDLGQVGVPGTPLAKQTIPSVVPGLTYSGGPLNNLIAAGAQHTCSLSAGSLKCWGRGSEGQVGHPGFPSQVTPTPVPSASDVYHLVAGSYHTCIAVGDGALSAGVYCFGQNYYGQLAPGLTQGNFSGLQDVRVARRAGAVGGRQSYLRGRRTGGLPNGSLRWMESHGAARRR